MIEFYSKIERYSKNGEKTGWTFVEVPFDIAEKIKPNTRTSYRVKGIIDTLEIKQVALIPLGEGNFIIPLNANMRKGINASLGDKIALKIEEDTSEYLLSADLTNTIELDSDANDFFYCLSKGHQRYFSNWIESAKTIETKTKRLEQTLYALSRKMDYGEMIRHFKKTKD